MTRYELLVGEPWNFEGPDGPNRLLVYFGGFVPGQNRADEYILLKAVTPFQQNLELVEFMIASPRHIDSTVYEIAKQGGIVVVACIHPNASMVRDDPFAPADVVSVLIGSLTPLPENKAIE